MLLNNLEDKINENKRKKIVEMNREIRSYYAENYESKSVDDNKILYETRDGKSIVDSPFAIFLELAINKRYENFKHVWIIDGDSEGIKQSIPKDLLEKVHFVKRGTLAYVDEMLTAKYLISNSTFESFFTKKSNQVYINTWHGTPLKHMGFDIPGMVNHSQNVLRNFLMADYILSPNEHTSEIFINSYKLKGIYPGKLLEGGYPRIDLTLNSNSDVVKSRIREHGAVVGNKPIILFCPTWKGTSIHETEDDVNQIINETLMLVERFKPTYDILLKVHPFVFKKIQGESRISNYLVSDLIDANQVLSITDLLITDYSSIFFDFLVTKKPIVFYSWDRDIYQENRGMYLLEDSLPGPICENLEEVITSIENIEQIEADYKERYQLLSQTMVPYEDGNVTQKYVNYIFSGERSNLIKEYELDSEKKKLLIYPGGMVNNGITSSFLNLVNNINYDLYDVTVIMNSNQNNEVNDNIKLLNKNVRPIFRFGTNILTKKEVELDKVFNVQGITHDERKLYPEKGYKREMDRLTASLNFDVAIDFSGYSYFWARHILSVNAKHYVAFMHNDLMADSEKIINGEQPRKKDLQSLFTIYYKFDRLLSVSPMTMEVNLNSLKDYVTKEQMSYVYNSINIEHILKETSSEIKESNNNVISAVVKKKLVTENKRIHYYKNLSGIQEDKKYFIEIKKNDEVYEYATYLLDECSYSKVSIEGFYLGWIETRYLKNAPVKIDKMRREHFFGTVSRGYHFPIWKELRTNTESDQIVCYARHFKQRYLEVTQSAETVNGKYYLVSYNGKKIGWMSTNPLMRIHKVDPFQLKKVIFRKKMSRLEKKQPICFSKEVNNDLKLFAKLKTNKKVSLWDVPSNVIDAVEIQLSNEYFKTAFKVEQEIIFSDQTYYRLSLDDGSFVGYVRQDMIEFINSVEYVKETAEKKEEDILSILPKVDLVMQKIPEFDPNFVNFINMGRLSPEKNQSALISAFKKFNDKISDSRLYILGDGPLKHELANHIRSLNMEGKVVLLGHLKRPFDFIKLTDLFVLPSLYEGQPMVLLECLTIGMKILASDIPANINVIGKDEKYGLLTEGTSVDAIYNGLKRANENKSEFAEFDYHEYNELAITNFYDKITF